MPNGTKPICSFTGTLTMNLVSLSREGFDNKLTFKINIFPPLYVFKSNPNLLTTFSFSTPDLAITEISFDPYNNQLIIKADLSADLAGQTIDILFKPDLGNDNRYFATTSQSIPLVFSANDEHMLYFYSQTTVKMANSLLYISYVLVVLSWISFIFGLVSRRLAGLEAMIVVQFSFVNVLWLNSYLNLSFQQISPLKYSTFYNIPNIIS